LGISNAGKDGEFIMLGRMGNFYCWEGWGISNAGKDGEFLML